MDKLAPCPCGRPISELQISDSGQGNKWANVAGNCCGEWMVEFRTLNENLTSEKCMSLAMEAWNKAPRHDKTQQLLAAAKAVIERWDSPMWKHQEHTGKFIDELRKAVGRFDEEHQK
jgi:hypothetical protein